MVTPKHHRKRQFFQVVSRPRTRGRTRNLAPAKRRGSASLSLAEDVSNSFRSPVLAQPLPTRLHSVGSEKCGSPPMVSSSDARETSTLPRLRGSQRETDPLR